MTAIAAAPETGIQLRVCLLLEAAATGVGRHVADLADELICRGNEVHVIHSANNIDDRFVQRAKELKAQGCSIISRPMRHGGHPSDISLVAWVRRYLRANGPFDVLHCHSTKAGLIGRVAAIGMGMNVLYTPHAFFTMKPGMSNFSRKSVALLEASLSRLSSHVVAVSEREGSHAEEIGISLSRIQVVPNGVHAIQRAESVDQTRRRIREQYNIPLDDVCIGFVGRLNAQKAVDHLLESFAQVIQDESSCHARLLIIGDGPLKSFLKSLADQLGLTDRVHWLGDINGQDAICAFDVFALASDYEGLPYVVLEALSAGIPIVTTDVGGMDELVDSGVNGYVVPPRNARAFSNALNKVIQNNSLRKQMSNASKHRAQHFSVERMVDRLIQLYQSTPISQ